jgi:serine/threonine protein kinase
VNDFDLIKVIGRGSYGKVLKVKHKGTGQVYAMKVLNKKVILDKNELEHTKNERSILVKLRSPFLVTLHYAFQTADRYTASSSLSPLASPDRRSGLTTSPRCCVRARLYFVMDYINGGELFHHLQKDKKFNDERVKFYAAEIVLGLEYLHTYLPYTPSSSSPAFLAVC